MIQYEGMFVVANKEARKDHDYLEEHVRMLLDKVKAKVVRLNKWDERQLAYEIDGQRDGIFFLCYFEADGGSIPELRREADLSELVLRLLVLRLDSIPDEEEVERRSGRVSRESRDGDTTVPAKEPKPAEGATPAEGAADKPAEGSAEKPAEASAEKPAEGAAEKPAEEPAAATTGDDAESKEG